MSNKAFLSRFQNKISTVSAQGKITGSGSSTAYPSPSSSVHVNQGPVSFFHTSSPGEEGPARRESPGLGVETFAGSKKYVVPEYESGLFLKPEFMETSTRQPEVTASPVSAEKKSKKKLGLKDLQDASNPFVSEDQGPPSVPSSVPSQGSSTSNQSESFPLKKAIKEASTKKQAPSTKTKSRSSRTSQVPSSSPGDKAPRNSVNESKAKSPEELLMFSKKPREVKYEPKTLEEYKKTVTDKYYELGKLQPDLNADELVQKRANLERIKEFSKNLRDINIQKAGQPKKKPLVEMKDIEKEKSKREKALEFAKKIPKPKPVPRDTEEREGEGECVTSVQSGRKSSRSQSLKETSRIEREPQSSELEELEMRHFQARKNVEEIRRLFA